MKVTKEQFASRYLNRMKKRILEDDEDWMAPSLRITKAKECYAHSYDFLTEKIGLVLVDREKLKEKLDIRNPDTLSICCRRLIKELLE